jgi:hypothetical protein
MGRFRPMGPEPTGSAAQCSGISTAGREVSVALLTLVLIMNSTHCLARLVMRVCPLSTQVRPRGGTRIPSPSFLPFIISPLPGCLNPTPILYNLPYLPQYLQLSITQDAHHYPSRRKEISDKVRIGMLYILGSPNYSPIAVNYFVAVFQKKHFAPPNALVRNPALLLAQLLAWNILNFCIQCSQSHTTHW